ncbi:ATPase, partial [bacterium]|nr:ATPase [bacterium]
MNEVRDLALLIDAGVPIIAIETHEEPRALQLLSQLAIQRNLPMLSWTITDGLRRSDITGQKPQPDSCDPEAALEQLKQNPQANLAVLCDFHHYLNGQPRITRLLKDIALQAESSGQTLILMGHALDIPKDIERLCAGFNLTLPSEAQLMRVIHQEAQQWSSKQRGKRVNMADNAISQLAKSMRGLSLDEAKRLARGAIVDDGAITESDIDAVNRAKFALMNMDSVLSYEYDTEKCAQVAGFKRLTHWLTIRKD